jgi:hypothetical protein
MQALTEATRRDFQTQLKQAKAQAEHEREKDAAVAATVVFRRQFDTVVEHNCWTRLKKSTYLSRQQAEVIQNHENEHVSSTG